MNNNWKFISHPNQIYPKINWLIKKVKELCLDNQSGGLYSLGALEINFDSANDSFTSALQKAAFLINNSDTFELTGDYLPIVKITYQGVFYSITFNIKAVGTFGVGGDTSLSEDNLFVASRFIDTGNPSDSIKYYNENLVPETQGGFYQGEPATPSEGLTVQESLDKLIFPATQPLISFNVNNELIEKGSDYSKTIVINFSQNDAGVLLSYSLEKDGVEVSTLQSTDFTANEVLNDFTLQAKVSHDASSQLSANTISTNLKTISQAVPQWKGQKANGNSFDGATYNQFNSDLNKFISNNDNASITVTAGKYGFFISKNPNATIIENGTGLALAQSAVQKNTITAKLINGDNVTLTEYIIPPSGGDFTYNLN